MQDIVTTVSAAFFIGIFAWAFNVNRNITKLVVNSTIVTRQLTSIVKKLDTYQETLHEHDKRISLLEKE